MATDITNFHQNNYIQKVAFLTQHLSRMWTRFNIFIVAETAIFGGRVFFSDKPQNEIENLMLIGLGVSMIWYIIGAQDKYLVNLYRDEVKESFDLYKTSSDISLKNEILTYAGQASGEATKMHNKDSVNPMIAWHSTQFTTTSMASIVPLLLSLTWIGLLTQDRYHYDWWILPLLLVIFLWVEGLIKKWNKKRAKIKESKL